MMNKFRARAACTACRVLLCCVARRAASFSPESSKHTLGPWKGPNSTNGSQLPHTTPRTGSHTHTPDDASPRTLTPTPSRPRAAHSATHTRARPGTLRRCAWKAKKPCGSREWGGRGGGAVEGTAAGGRFFFHSWSSFFCVGSTALSRLRLRRPAAPPRTVCVRPLRRVQKMAVRTVLVVAFCVPAASWFRPPLWVTKRSLPPLKGVPGTVLDTVGDGQPDALLVDATGDGRADELLPFNTTTPGATVDTIGDGRPDTLMLDTRDNGCVDRAVPLDSALPLQAEAQRLLVNPALEVASIFSALVLIAVFAIGADAEGVTLSAESVAAISMVEDAFTTFFLIEFLVRWWAAGLAPSALLRPLTAIDFLNLVPFIIKLICLVSGVGDPLQNGSPLEALRILRALRVLRLYKFFGETEVNQLARAVSGDSTVCVPKAQRIGARVAFSVCSIVLVSAGAEWLLERAVNPALATCKPVRLQLARTHRLSSTGAALTDCGRELEIPRMQTPTRSTSPSRRCAQPTTIEPWTRMPASAHSARLMVLACCLAPTIRLCSTTVGYGDVAPVTGAGRLVVAMEMIAAVTVIPFEVTALSRALADRSASASRTAEGASSSGSAPAGDVSCDRCGLDAHDIDARFCKRCGERLATARSTTAREKSKRRSRWDASVERTSGSRV